MKAPVDQKGAAEIRYSLRQGGTRSRAFAEAFGIRGARLDEALEDDAAMLDALDRALETMPDDLEDDLLDLMPKVRTMRIHPIAIAICAHHGIAPVLLCAFSEWADESVTLEMDGGDAIGMFYDSRKNQATVSYHMSRDAIWEHDGYAGSVIEISKPFPETVVAALVGKPASTVIGHPVFDALGLTITHAKNVDGSLVVKMTLP